jgi:hypothetical protein
MPAAAAGTARFRGHRMLGAPLALEGAVADEIEDAILRRRQSLPGVLGEPPPQGLRAPGGRAQQAAVLLVRYLGRAVTRELLQIGAFAIDEMQHQQPAEDQAVPVAKARPQHPRYCDTRWGKPSRTWSGPPGGYEICPAMTIKYPGDGLDCKGLSGPIMSKPVTFQS